MAFKICILRFITFLIITGASAANFIAVDFTRTLDVGGLTTRTYTNFLVDLRRSLAHTYSGREMVAVLPVFSNVDPRGFDVTLRSGTITTTVRFRRDDLYLVGYRMQSGTWLEFGRSRPPQFIQGSQFLGFENSYPALERIAGSVVNMEFNKKKLIASVQNLASSTNKEARAEALLVTIQMISEAARFLNVSALFASNLERKAKVPGWMRHDLQNNWDDLSYMVLKSEADPCYRFPRPRINGQTITTVNALRQFFGVMKRDADTLRPPCSATLDGEMKDVFELDAHLGPKMVVQA